MAKVGKSTESYRNLDWRKSYKHIVQATTTLCLLFENNVDQMPHKSRTMESKEKVPSVCLQSSFFWSETLLEINKVNTQFNLQQILMSNLNNIWHTSSLNFAPKASIDTFKIWFVQLIQASEECLNFLFYGSRQMVQNTLNPPCGTKGQ